MKPKTIEEYRQEVRDDFGPDVDELVLIDALAVCRQIRDREKETWVCSECEIGVVSYVVAMRLYKCDTCLMNFPGRSL